MASQIYLVDHNIKWETFKILQLNLVVKNGIASSQEIDRALWELVRDKRIYCWFDPRESQDMILSLELPKNKKIVIISSPITHISQDGD